MIKKHLPSLTIWQDDAYKNYITVPTPAAQISPASYSKTVTKRTSSSHQTEAATDVSCQYQRLYKDNLHPVYINDQLNNIFRQSKLTQESKN